MTLPPGRLRLTTRPSATGLLPVTNTIGTVAVAVLAARAAATPPGVAMTVTGRFTRSAANFGSRPTFAVRPAVFDRHVAALGVASFTQALCEIRRTYFAFASGEPGWRNPITGIAGLLRPRRQRPHRRAAQQRDELAASHSITSSARASSDGGTVTPIAFAVLRLMISSNLVGCSTGSSAGLIPCRILRT